MKCTLKVLNQVSEKRILFAPHKRKERKNVRPLAEAQFVYDEHIWRMWKIVVNKIFIYLSMIKNEWQKYFRKVRDNGDTVFFAIGLTISLTSKVRDTEIKQFIIRCRARNIFLIVGQDHGNHFFFDEANIYSYIIATLFGFL